MSFIIQEQAGGLYASDIETAVYPVTLPTSVTTGSEGIRKVVNLTTTSELLLFTTTNGVMAMVFDSVANAFGSVVLVRASVSNAVIAAVKISSTQVLVSTLVANTTALETVVLSVSGTTITVNTPLATTLGAASSIFTRGDPIIQVGSSYALGLRRTTECYAVAFTISGTTVTAGSELALGIQGNLSISQFIPFSSTVFVVVGSQLATFLTLFQPVSVSGTTLTLGTGATDIVGSQNTPVGIGLSANNNILYIGGATASNIRGLVVTITGTVASISGVTIGNSGSGSPTVSQSIVIGNQMMATCTAGLTNTVLMTGVTDVAGVATAPVNYYVGNPNIIGFDDSGVVYMRDLTYGFYYARFSGNDVVADPKFFIRFNSASPFINMSLFSAHLSNWETQTSLLRTSSGKQCSPSAGTSALLYSYALNESPVVQQVSDLAGAATFTRSTLSDAQGWFMYRQSLSGLVQKVVLT